MIRRVLVAALYLSTPVAFAQLPHLELSVDLDPATGAFRAEAQISPAPAARFDFELAAGLAIDETMLDGRAVATERFPSGRFAVEIPSPATTHKLVLRYRGTLDSQDAALSHRDVLQSLPPMVSTDGSFLPAGSGWYPDPGKSFTYRLTVRTSKGQIAVAPGAPVRETEDGAQQLSVFDFVHPADGIDLMAGPYRVTERRVGIDRKRIRLRTYFHSGLESLAESYLNASALFIERYSREIGDYPYSDFSIVSSPLPTGFGMPTLTYLGREVLKLPFIRAISLGHEVLHNWWGNGVLVDPARGNWSEGLTTFMADYAYKEDTGGDAVKEMRHGWLRDLVSIPPGSEQPLSAFRARHHVASSAIGYGKAAMLFFSLREWLGADRFHAALRDFWQQHRFSNASFDDLRRAFERASGEDLAAFFDQWLDRTGAAALRIASATRSKGEAKTKLTVAIAQDLPDRAARVPLRVVYDGHHRDAVVEVAGDSTTVALDVAPGARAVQLDPDFTVWRRLAASESPPILRDAVAAPRLNVLVLDKTLETEALKFAGAFAEGEARTVSSAQTAGSRDALLVVGAGAAVDDYLSAQRLPARPREATDGQIQSWVIAGPANSIMLVSLPDKTVEANAALSQLARRLPHLARYSWVAFEHGRISGRGNWPAVSPRIPVQ